MKVITLLQPGNCAVKVASNITTLSSLRSPKHFSLCAGVFEVVGGKNTLIRSNVVDMHMACKDCSSFAMRYQLQKLTYPDL